VPILTNDDADEHDMHPGFRMNLASAVRIAYALPMIDALEELLRKIRPYELEPGSAQTAFDEGLDAVICGIGHGLGGMNAGFRRAVALMGEVAYDRSKPRPRVLIVGEYLLNFHPGANRDIENYLERNGFEIVEARMTDVIRKTYFYKHAQSREFKVDKPLSWRATNAVSDSFFELAHNNCDRIARAHPLYEPPCRMPELVAVSDDIVHHTFDAGEGVLIPAEIIHHAKHGVGSFVILQPFGCLPNHIVGRGIVARLKRDFPQAHILSLDYDPDMSFANVENRLQMLVMAVHEGDEKEG
jgi:predicted nucleotide-binding protein (sugar kinase/HSP70/actin superfamily)